MNCQTCLNCTTKAAWNAMYNKLLKENPKEIYRQWVKRIKAQDEKWLLCRAPKPPEEDWDSFLDMDSAQEMAR